MSGKLSRLWKTLDKKKSEGKLILPRQLDDEDEIASYASINDSAVSCVGPARQSCVNCPTCQGTGRIPREQEEQLVALIPYGDQRLKPRQTKFYVCLAVTICLLTTSLSIFFLFPRGATVLPAGLSASSVSFDATTTSIDLNMTNVLNVTNNNFCGVTVVQLEAEVLHQSLVVGKATTTTLLSMSPLQSSQVSSVLSCFLLNSSGYPRQGGAHCVLDPLLCHLSAKYSKLLQLPTSHLAKGCCKNLRIAEFEAITFLGKKDLSALPVVSWVVRLP
ncbi:transmembrane protein 106A isoform X1 [Cuculus canorus]|uniref:transmembrane protein 106A isoform X1 n=1 Tax=Cuculus canorus TaxID=55661 RepID=UPI0023AA9A21|nr:transmembrane protein 106A isoform X1 [Cuculus canorus]